METFSYEDLTWVLYGGAWSPTNEIRRIGGPNCAAYFSFQFKLFACIFKVAQHCVFLSYCHKFFDRKMKEHKLEMEKTRSKPYMIEYFIGFLLAVVLIWQTITKIITGNLVQMCNACHVALFIQMYQLVTPRTYWSCYWYSQNQNIVCFLIIGQAFADPVGFTYNFEAELLYIEHILPLVGFFMMFFIGRYKAFWFSDIKISTMGLSWSAIYFHTVLWAASESSWANLSYMLCPNEFNDPCFANFGDSYYLVGEYTWVIGMIIFRYSWIFLDIVLTYIMGFIFTNKNHLKTQ